MPIVRKIGEWLWAFLRYLWGKFMKLSWTGKAIAVAVIVNMGNTGIGLPLAMIFITLAVVLYMIRSLAHNMKL